MTEELGYFTPSNVASPLLFVFAPPLVFVFPFTFAPPFMFALAPPDTFGALTPRSGPFSPPITPKPKSIPRTTAARPKSPQRTQQQGLQQEALAFLFAGSTIARFY